MIRPAQFLCLVAAALFGLYTCFVAVVYGLLKFGMWIIWGQ